MNSGVTYLTDLPELDALEPHQPHIQPGYDKFIRDAHGRPGGRDPYRQLSGMTETGSSMTRPPMVPFNAGPVQVPQVPAGRPADANGRRRRCDHLPPGVCAYRELSDLQQLLQARQYDVVRHYGRHDDRDHFLAQKVVRHSA